MTIKHALPIALFFAATAASANGGLSIDNVDQSMNSENWVQTNSVAPEINVQGPLAAFENYIAETREFVDTDALRQDFDGQS